MRRKTRLLLFYYLTLAFVCALTIVGPVIGGSIDKLNLTTPGATVGCKSVDFGALVGANVNTGFGISPVVGSFDYSAGLINSAPDTVKLVLDGSGAPGAAFDVDFSFDVSGFSSPSAFSIALNGASTGMSGFFGISMLSAGGATCASYEVACLDFSTGSISESSGAVSFSHAEPFTLYGRLHITGSGSLNFGPNSADIVIAAPPPSEVPEPGSVVLLIGGLAAMAMLRRRISRA